MKAWAKSGGLKLAGKHGKMEVYSTKARNQQRGGKSSEDAEKDEGARGRAAEWQQRPSSYRHLHPKIRTEQK